MKIAWFTCPGRTGYGVVIHEDSIVEPSAGFLSRHPDIRSVLAANATQALARDVAGRPAGFTLDAVMLLPPDPDHIIVFAKHHEAMEGPGALRAQRRHQGITMAACANV